MLFNSYIGLRTLLRLKDVGIDSLKELATRDVIRAPAFVIKEVRDLFKKLDIEFNGRYEERFSETPYTRLVPRMDVSFEPSSLSSPRSRVGGVPNRTPATDDWPICKGCERPMHFIGQLVGPIGLGKVKLKANEAIQLYACFYADSFCMSWVPGAGANRAHVVTNLDESTRTSSTPPFPPFAINYSEGWDNAIVRTKVVDESDLDEYLEACNHALTDKFGGITLNKEESDAAKCPECQSPMMMIAQFASDVVPNPLGHGLCYIHLCPDKHAATLEYDEKV